MPVQTQAYRGAVLMLLVMASVLPACSPTRPGPAPTPPPPPPPAATYALSGVVVENTAAGLAPVSGVDVRISSKSARTDANGRYTLTGLTAGTYVLRTNSLWHEPSSRTVRIDADAELDLQIVRLPIYTLSGRVHEVIDGVAVPIAGVHVENSNLHSMALTDETGFYSVTTLAGDAHLWVAKDGYHDGSWEILHVSGDTVLDLVLVRK